MTERRPLVEYRPGKTLLASAKRLTGSELRNRLGTKRSSESRGWQDDAWDMYDLVGEQRFLTNTLASRTGQAYLFVGRMEDPNSNPARIRWDDPDAKHHGYLEALGSRAYLSQMIVRLAINLFMAGEGWLVGIPTEGGEAEYDWRMLSVSEVTVSEVTGKVEIQVEGETRGFDPDDLWLIRIWNPHPRRTQEADSPTRACLPILREIVSLSMYISAQMDSRLAGAGLLLVPEGAKRAINTAAGLPEDTEQDPFTEALIEAMMAPVNDRGSASALVPLVVTVPDALTKEFVHLEFSTPLDGEARPMRDDAVKRLANSQDTPPELLLGTAGMNHWGGWLIKEETVNTHIEPRLALICDALTTQYLHPMMIDDGVEDYQKYVIWYDVSHLKARPNRSGDAKELHARGLISDEALRRETGFDESDAPEEELDPAIRLVLDMVTASPTLVEKPGLPFLVQQIQALLDGEIEEESIQALLAAEPEPDPEVTALPETSEDEPKTPQEEAPE